MKFGKTFEKNLTIEWRQHYIKYAELKDMIRNGVESAPRRADKSVYELHNLEFADWFFSVMKEELSRVNDFFIYKLAEARRKHATFKVKLMYIVRNSGVHKNNVPTLPPLADQPRNVRQLSRAYTEFYFSLVLLNNFQQLNLTGFYKICKKFDKYIGSTHGHSWHNRHVGPSTLNKDKELRSMIVEVENLYTEFLAKGDRTKAMAKLRVPPLGQPTSPRQVFAAGVVLGLFIVSAIMCIISYYIMFDKPDMLDSFTRLYRGPFALLLYCFFLSINVYIWQSAGINHVLIFEVNPRNHIEPVMILGIASFLGYICTLSMLIFIHHKEFGVSDPLYVPLICLVLPLGLLINPLPIMKYQGRIWILKILCRIIAAPCYNVTFADFWVADQMNSLVLCMVDYYHLIRFYIRYTMDSISSFDFEPSYAVTIIRCLPAWFRLAQCLRRYSDSPLRSESYLVNAFTYGSSLIVVIISTIQMETNYKYEYLFDNPWTWGYVISSFISTMYCTAWDLLQDFGLFQEWTGENMFLRENLVYPKWFYFFAIVANVLIRFVWVLELYLIYYDFFLPYNCKTISSLCEITRRFIWNFLRLENEHLYNCGHFRATRDIYISALNSREDLLVESIMGEQSTRASAELH